MQVFSMCPFLVYMFFDSPCMDSVDGTCDHLLKQPNVYRQCPHSRQHCYRKERDECDGTDDCPGGEGNGHGDCGEGFWGVEKKCY